MKRLWSCSLGVVAVFLMRGWVLGDVFTLDIDGPLEMEGFAGEVVPASFLCTLDHEEGTGPGAEGWSISVLVENAVVVGITTDGTAAAPASQGGYYEGGFNITEIVDPARNGGKQGAVSSIVLSFTRQVTLPRLTKQGIAFLDIEATMPSGEGMARLSYTDGLVGHGEPVQNLVRQDSRLVVPVKGETIVPLRGRDSCCGKRLNVGFSGEVIRKDTDEDVFAGILGGDDARCLAMGGTLVTRVAAGEVGFTHLYANVISNLPEEPATSRVEAWSLAIHVDGDVDIKTVTTAGTAADTVANGGFFGSGYNRTEIVDPAWNDGLRGCVSVVVLSSNGGASLPRLGTQSVLDMGIEAASAQGFADITGELVFMSGLTFPGGEQVMNAITVGGSPQSACNFDWARATVEFSVYFPRQKFFRRGLLNGDSKLNIADPIFLVNALFRSGTPLRCVAAGDANADEVTDISDAVHLIHYLFLYGPPPAGPFDECGPAPESRCADDTAECLQ